MIKAWVFLPTKLLAQVVITPFFHLHVRGTENLPEDNGFVLLVKHQRWTDIPLLGLAASRPLYYVAKQELFTHKPIGWYLRALGGIPLDRSKPIKSKDSFRLVKQILEAKQGIVVFPEGTYYMGAMGPLKPGMIRFLLKRAENVNFVPVGIQYIKGTLRTRMNVRFGKPLWRKYYGSDEVFIAEVGNIIASLSGISHNIEKQCLQNKLRSKKVTQHWCPK